MSRAFIRRKKLFISGLGLGTSIFCYEMNLGIVNAIYKSERIPADSENGLSEYSPCPVNFCEAYNL